MTSTTAKDSRPDEAVQYQRQKDARQFVETLISKDVGSNSRQSDAVVTVGKRTFSQFDAEIRKKNVIMAVLGSFTILMQLFILQWPWNAEKAIYDKDLFIIRVCECLAALVSVFLLYRLYDYYLMQIDLERLKYKQKFLPHLWETELWSPFLIECCICIIHPIPFMDMKYLGMMSGLKLYLWGRVYRDYSSIYTWRQDVIDAIDPTHGIPRFTTWLSVRTLFYRSPWLFVFSSVFSCVGIFAYMVYVMERENTNLSCVSDVTSSCYTDPNHSCCFSPFTSFAISVYFTSVTMTSVGYGDYTCSTPWGRVIAMWAAVTGLCLAALLLTALLTEFQLSFSQQFAADFCNLKDMAEQEEILAASFIQAWWRRAKCNEGYYQPGEYRGLKIAKYSSSSAAVAREQDDLDALVKHLPSATDRPYCCGPTLDDMLIDANKAFKQYSIQKDAALNTDNEVGMNVFRHVKVMTHAFERMSKKVASVQEQQSRFEESMQKLVTLFGKLPQVMDAEALVNLDIGFEHDKLPDTVKRQEAGGTQFQYNRSEGERRGAPLSVTVDAARGNAPSEEDENAHFYREKKGGKS